MSIHYTDDSVTLHHGDCLDTLRTLPDASVDSVVTDPPYALEFMGKKWDGWATPLAFQQWCTEWATECLRVLKPGGHLLAFGGTRTWHRLAAAVEDAGFEIRDSIAWLYGSGFPKSMDVSKAIDRSAGAVREVVGTNPRAAQQTAKRDTTTLGAFAGASSDLTAPATDDAKRWEGWGTALKPAFEPIVVGRKPLSGTVAANVLSYGTGALNIHACRTNPGSYVPGGGNGTANQSNTLGGGPQYSGERPVVDPHTFGRWPANVLLDDTQATELDWQSGIRISGGSVRGDEPSARTSGVYGKHERTPFVGHVDTGGASRFFPTFRYEAKAPTSERPSVAGVQHPTVKPLELMRWLVRLVTPPNGVVLEPFAGSGTTAEACVHEHMKCIAIEREADYLPLIVARLTKPIEVGFDFGGAA